MSVRQALLALLEQGPMYGYQLRSEFERRTGSTWPLNVGQVYTTLTRLERDGLVAEDGADGEGHVVYRVTDAGREEVATWFTTPVERTQPPRDELAIKLGPRGHGPGRRRRHGHPAATNRHDGRAPGLHPAQARPRRRPAARTVGADMAWSLVLDSLVFAAEAEVRWLDHCEARLRRAQLERADAPHGPGPGRLSEGSQAMTAVLQLDSVTRVHGDGETAVQALRGVSFAAHAGELVAIMGPSGSGKSTLLTLAGGLDSPTSGTVSVEGTDLAMLGANGRARMRRTSIGYVFQDFNLIPALTAAENVALPRELDGESSRAARTLARAALEEVGIGELADRFPDNMSGGQQQRVAIARAVVGDRRLILADEPTGALDTETGEEILRLLRARCDAGAAGVLVTHEARHAAWADRVVFLRDGVVVDETGTDGVEALVDAGATR